MNIDHEFTVPAPAERAWALLTDLEQVATCMPGAQLTGFEDGAYQGLVKVKVGPVTAQYRGTASFVEKDDDAYHAVVSAKGQEARGSGTAAATIDLRLRPEGDESTVVSVGTDLKISGKLAQFGAGMIQEVSAKLLGQFTACLEERIGSGGRDAGAGEDAAAAPAATEAAAPAGAAEAPAVADAAAPAEGVPDVAGSTPAPAPVQAPRAVAPVAGPEPAAVDLVGVVGPALLKRLAPVIAVLVVAFILFRWLRG
jgi:carbon monoxide dehydrogenase subunit G